MKNKNRIIKKNGWFYEYEVLCPDCVEFLDLRGGIDWLDDEQKKGGCTVCGGQGDKCLSALVELNPWDERLSALV